MYLKKELYELIRTDESIFDFIQESSLDGLWYWDIEHPENEWMNTKFWTVLGYNPDEMPHKSSAWQNIINQDDLKVANDNFSKHCENPEHPYDQIVRYTHKNGSTVWIRCRGLAIRDKNGKAVRMLGAHQDISDIKRSEQELFKAKEKSEESERKLKSIFRVAPTGIGVIKNRTFVEVNLRVSEMTGYSSEELVGQSARILYPTQEEYEFVDREKYEQIAKHGTGTVETRWQRKDGKIMDVLFSSTPLDSHDLSKGVTFTALDISERKDAEIQLQIAKDDLQTISDNMLDLVSLTDMEGNYKFAGSSHKILGYEIDYLIGKNVMDFVHPDDLPGVQAKFANFITNQKSTADVTYRNRCADGSYLWFETFGTLISDNDGNPKEILFNTRNITERKQAEQVLKANKEYLENLNNTLHDAVFTVKMPERKIEYVNNAITNIFGYLPHECIGNATDMLYPNENEYKKFSQVLMKALSSGLGHLSHECQLKKKNGQIFFAEITTSFIKDSGTLTEAISIVRDITERKQAELLLQKKNDEITAQNEELNKANLELIAAKEKDEESKRLQRVQNEEIKLNNARLESLLKISKYQTNSIQELLDFALAEAIKLTNSKIGYIYFYQETTRQFILNTWSDEVMDECRVINPQTVYDLDKTGCWGEAVRQRKPIVINNYQEANPIKKGTPKGHVQLLKFLTIPVIIEGKIVAVAGVANKDTDYNDADIRQLTLLMDNVWKISERVELVNNLESAKAKAEESEGKLKEAQRIAHMGNWELNIETSKLFWSDEIYRIFDCEPQEFNATYEAFLEFIHPDDREKVNSAYLNSLETKKEYQIEHRLITKNNQEKYVKEKCRTTYNEQGKPLNSFGIVIDITEQKALENALIKANRALKVSEAELSELNATKDKFFSIIAHDLKSPFNSIMGFSELLVAQISEKNYDEIEEYAGLILNSSKRAMDLLMNLMEWSRSQTGRMEFNPERIDLTEFINDITQLFDDSAGQKGIIIKKKYPAHAPVFADQAMISAVLRNLISNAIKFTKPGGEIILAVTKEKNKLTVSVKDNGIGIPNENIDKLFRIDENFSTRGTANEAGTGLGLMLCKEFIEMHDEEIWVESKEGKGSTFYFTLPYNAETVMKQ